MIPGKSLGKYDLGLKPTNHKGLGVWGSGFRGLGFSVLGFKSLRVKGS